MINWDHSHFKEPQEWVGPINSMALALSSLLYLPSLDAHIILYTFHLAPGRSLLRWLWSSPCQLPGARSQRFLGQGLGPYPSSIWPRMNPPPKHSVSLVVSIRGSVVTCCSGWGHWAYESHCVLLREPHIFALCPSSISFLLGGKGVSVTPTCPSGRSEQGSFTHSFQPLWTGPFRHLT